MIKKLITSVQHGFGVGFWEVAKILILNFSKNIVKSEIFVLLRFKFLKIWFWRKFSSFFKKIRLLISNLVFRLHQNVTSNKEACNSTACNHMSCNHIACNHTACKQKACNHEACKQTGCKQSFQTNSLQPNSLQPHSIQIVSEKDVS